MTTERLRLEPTAEHDIIIDPYEGRVIVQAGSVVIADTRSALELRETNYDPVRYVPLDDVDQSLLRPSDHHTYCPYKGEASYYDISLEDGTELAAAVWYYPEPYPAVASIRDHVAFYPDKVNIATVPESERQSA